MNYVFILQTVIIQLIDIVFNGFILFLQTSRKSLKFFFWKSYCVMLVFTIILLIVKILLYIICS